MKLTLTLWLSYYSLIKCYKIYTSTQKVLMLLDLIYFSGYKNRSVRADLFVTKYHLKHQKSLNIIAELKDYF